MSVVGFDFGSEYCVIAVARRRGIEVLQNEVGNRRTTAMVAFSNKQRLLGDEAVSMYSSNYKNTVTDFKRFAGRKMTDPDLKEELKFLPLKVVDLNGSVGFSVQYEGKTEVLRVEAVTAAMFQKLKSIAEAGLDGQKVHDCVIGCPSYFTDSQRRCLLDAANVAGLNVLRLMNETAAVALNYGILRPLPKEETREVCFVDIGKTSTQCAVVSFTQGKLKVLSSTSDIHLGGRDFDEIIVQHFAAEIKEKYKLDVLSEAKPTMKLRKECERIKRILSANSTVHMNVEYIMNDTDVKGEIKRPFFEEIAQKDLLGRIKAVVEKCVAASGIPADKMFGCEIIGGATRIPCVQTVLASVFGKEVNKTCDSDESIARGCALQCAMLSPSFRVRDFDVQDVSPYAIDISWGPVGENASVDDKQTLFTAFNSIPSVKMISFSDRKDALQLTARYTDPTLLPPGQTDLLGRFVVNGIPPVSEEEQNPRTKVKIKLNIHGILSLASAQVLTELEEPAPMEDEKPAEGEKDVPPGMEPLPKAEDAGTAEGATEEDKDANMKEDAPAPEDEAATGGDTPMEEEDLKKPEVKAEAKPEEKKKKVKRTDLAITSEINSGMDEATLKALFEREGAMANNDRVIAETNAARNDLEGYCLEMRSKVQDGNLKEYMADSIKDEFCSKCMDMEDWLYDEGYEAQKSEFKKRLTELKKYGDPCENRLWEDTHRGEWVAHLKSEIGHWSNLADSKDEKYAHIEEEERNKVKTACAAADEWLAAELGKQDKVSKSEDPSLTCAAIDNKKKALTKEAHAVMSKPKPKPPKVEPKPEEAKKEEEAAAPEGEKPTENAEGSEAPAEGEDKSMEGDASQAAAEEPKMDMD